MTTEQTTQVETQTSQASSPAPESAGASGGQTTPNPGASDSSVPAVDTAAPQYTPNYKFKVYGEEKEFDEFIRPAINEKTEKSIRELYEKAYGLDGLKPKYQKLQEEYTGVNTKFSTMSQNIEYLDSLVREKDFGSFFDHLQVPRAEIARWVLQELKYQQMSPEEKAQIDSQKQQKLEARQYKEQVTDWQSKYESLAVETRQSQLQAATSKPEVTEMAKAFDARVGQPGAFQQEVIRRGAFHNMQGQDPSAEELVQEVIKIYGLQASSQSPQVPASAQPTTDVVQQKKDLPVIPNVKAGSTAPTKKVFKSLDEIRKHAQSMG